MAKDKNPFQILVIEDNPGDFILVKEYLLEQIHEPSIVHANNFVRASEILYRTTSEFDVILLDITLPDKSGQDLLTEILQHAGTQPVIILTGFADIEFSIQAISGGASDYLLKDDLNASSLYKSIVYCRERKKTLMELRESEQRYSNLFHLSPQPMWVCNIKTLQFMDVNSAAISHYGYSQQEFMSMTVNEIWEQNAGESVQYSLSSDQPFQRGVVRNRKKDGKVIHVDWHCNPLTYKGTEAVVILAHDITDTINYIRDIEIKNNKLVEIAWIQSHVVRAPLARMMGLIDLMKNPQIAATERDDLIEPLLASAYELDSLIKDILARTYDTDN